MILSEDKTIFYWSDCCRYILVIASSRWISLVMLTVGVALTQLSKAQEVSPTDEQSAAKLMTGFLTVMIAICLSGFAGDRRSLLLLLLFVARSFCHFNLHDVDNRRLLREDFEEEQL